MSEGYDALCEGLGSVIDQGVRPVLLGHGKLLCSAGASNDTRPHHLADFHCRETYSPCGAQHEEGFARREAALPAQGHMTGDIGNGKGASLLKPPAVRDGKRFVLNGNDLLSESTIEEDCHDPVPRSETRHPCPTLHNDTRRFQARTGLNGNGGRVW